MILSQTLWVTVFLALIMGAYGKLVAGHVRTSGRVEGALQARLLAQSGVDIGLAFISAQRTSRVLSEPFRITLDEGSILIKLENESGKIDVNKAPVGLISAAAGLAAIPEQAVSTWLATVNQYRSRGTLFKSLDQAMALAQLEEKDSIQFRKIYTVHSGLDFVDLNNASDQLARVLKSAGHNQWSGNANAGAYRIVSEGRHAGGAIFSYSATYLAQPLQQPAFRLVAFSSN